MFVTRGTYLFRQFYLSCVEDEDSSEEDDVEDDGEEVIALHGVLGEQDEKPDDLLDNYFLPGEDDFQVSDFEKNFFYGNILT